MICPQCHKSKLQVTNTRTRSRTNDVWRRRNCSKCNFTVTSVEQFDLVRLYKVQTTHSRKAFSPAKLMIDILSVLEFSKKPPEDAFWLARTVFELILSKYSISSCIDTKELTEIVYAALKAYDRLSAMAYQQRFM